MHELNRPRLEVFVADPLWSLRGVGHCYADGTPSLQGIDLDIAAGERIALVGPNGSGKSTLAKLLCGLLQPSTGSLRYQGQALTGDLLARARLDIGLLFQDPDDQLFGYTLLADVAFGPRNQGLSRELAEQAAQQALGQVGLAQWSGKQPHNLSYGQKKRASLAGLLAMQPQVLILDEPTANLDPQQEEVFLRILREFRGTLICISHDLIFLYELCTRAVVLDQGRIHHDYPFRELVAQRQALREHGLDFSFRLSASTPEATATLTDPGPTNPTPALEPDQPPLMQLQGFHFRYPDGSRALRDVTFSIGRGERIAIVGENGAGKSTLLACLMGLKWGRGSYRFAGRPMTVRHRRLLWRQTGMVFQDCADQLFSPSCYEEVAFGPRQFGYSKTEVENRVAKALKLTGLSGYETRVPLHLSGGERKRLALACALSMDPPILILDEPTAGLDPRSEAEILNILGSLEVTLILVSHDMHLVKALTRRTLVLHEGNILRDCPTSQFLEDGDLTSLNQLDYLSRDRCRLEILELQHRHEHRHAHRHLHEHEHRHGTLVHSHLHEHEHDHPHHYEHRHGVQPGSAAPRHEHPPATSVLHQHDHHGHEEEPHEHDH